MSEKQHIEIERKFLVDYEKLKQHLPSTCYQIEQYYLFDTDNGIVRIRHIFDGNESKYYLTIKGQGTLVRTEVEIEVDSSQYISLTSLHKSIIIKDRYIINNRGDKWEIDIFQGKLYGLVLAEIELKNINAILTLPDWVVKEVTEDTQFSNSNLSKISFKDLVF